jgi:hypothetical protein
MLENLRRHKKLVFAVAMQSEEYVELILASLLGETW